MVHLTYGALMSRQRHAPVIPGWVTQVEAATDDHPERLKATRVDELSDYAIEYGCRRQVFALTSAELEVLTIAETVHAAMVERAAQRAQDIARVADMVTDRA